MNTSTRAGDAMPETGRAGAVLVDADWLDEHLNDPLLRVVEVDVSAAAYDGGHIDGAVLWNIYEDLKDAEYRLVGARPLEELLSQSGIGPGTTVIFYGYGPALGFWLMKLYGHADARLLDCSRDAWRAEGRPWSAAVPEPPATNYPLGAMTRSLRVTAGDVESAIGRSATTLVDVRSEPEYRGERFWPSGGSQPDGRAGHVPGAAHYPLGDLYDSRGAFRSEAELRQAFSSFVSDDGELITYCTIGGRACTAWFVLTYLLGRHEVRVYDGSWAEWGRRHGSPVEIC